VNRDLLLYLYPDLKIPRRNINVSNLGKIYLEQKEKVKLAMHESHSKICLTSIVGLP